MAAGGGLVVKGIQPTVCDTTRLLLKPDLILPTARTLSLNGNKPIVAYTCAIGQSITVQRTGLITDTLTTHIKGSQLTNTIAQPIIDLIFRTIQLLTAF